MSSLSIQVSYAALLIGGPSPDTSADSTPVFFGNSGTVSDAILALRIGERSPF